MKQVNWNTPLQRHLARLGGIGACSAAIKWAGSRTPKQAWNDCCNPECLLFWAEHTTRNSPERVFETRSKVYYYVGYEVLNRVQDAAGSGVKVPSYFLYDCAKIACEMIRERLALPYGGKVVDKL